MTKEELAKWLHDNYAEDVADRLRNFNLLDLHFVGEQSERPCGFFEADNKTSSATKCKCGREKWEHPKDT